MTTFSPIDLFTLVGTICIVWLAVFLCWAIFEIARLVRQINQIVSGTRQQIARLEHGLEQLSEKFKAAGPYVAAALAFVQRLFLYFKKKKVKKAARKAEEI